jgi:hypothetical protein
MGIGFDFPIPMFFAFHPSSFPNVISRISDSRVETCLPAPMGESSEYFPLTGNNILQYQTFCGIYYSQGGGEAIVAKKKAKAKKKKTASKKKKSTAKKKKK